MILFLTLAVQARAEDVWFCKNIHQSGWILEVGKIKTYPPIDHRFKVSKSRLKFGSVGMNAYREMDVTMYDKDGIYDILAASDEKVIVVMDSDGLFRMSTVNNGGNFLHISKCELF